MAEATMQVQIRNEKGKQAAKKLRNHGLIPGILYGVGEKPTPLSLDRKELTVLLNKYGRNKVFELSLGAGKKVNAFIYEIQHSALSGDINHVDFKHISLKEKIHVILPVHLEGIPEGVKNEGGIIEMILHRLEVKGLPTDIPGQIIIDVKDMHLGDVVHVRDIKLENLELTLDPDAPVVQITAPKVVAAVVEEGAEGAVQPEVIGAKKPEE